MGSPKGTALLAFVTLKKGIAPSEVLKKELSAHVTKEIGATTLEDLNVLAALRGREE